MLVKSASLVLLFIVFSLGAFFLSKQFLTKPGSTDYIQPSPSTKVDIPTIIAPSPSSSLSPTPSPFPSFSPTLQPSPTLEKNGCFRTGCSGDFCSDKPIIGVCGTDDEGWKKISCTTDLMCERQANGECGFTLTSEYYQCLKK